MKIVWHRLTNYPLLFTPNYNSQQKKHVGGVSFDTCGHVCSRVNGFTKIFTKPSERFANHTCTIIGNLLVETDILHLFNDFCFVTASLLWNGQNICK